MSLFEKHIYTSEIFHEVVNPTNNQIYISMDIETQFDWMIENNENLFYQDNKESDRNSQELEI
jgi:hypothetical protein